MGKLSILFIILTLYAVSSESVVDTFELEKNCLHCHKEQQIPNSLIYKRYLMMYSTNGRMEEAMFKYLKDPKKAHSIMPTPFFLKFPMKEKMTLDDRKLKKAIRVYLEKYDIRKNLVLGK